MFRFIGLGDHAGSGIPKIYKNWKEQHWRLPLFREDPIHEQTLLELRMISLLPEGSVKMLDELFGEKFRKLPELERIMLITAATEDMVNHDRVKEIVADHPKDISDALAHLVHEKMLVKQGETRGSFYRLPGKGKLETTSLFQDTAAPDSPHSAGRSPHLAANSPHLPGNSPHLPDAQAQLAEVLGKLGLNSMPGKILPNLMQNVILEMCKDSFITSKELGLVLARDPKNLQNRYLTPMVVAGQLEMKYPANKNHPDQAYRTRKT